MKIENWKNAMNDVLKNGSDWKFTAVFRKKTSTFLIFSVYSQLCMNLNQLNLIVIQPNRLNQSVNNLSNLNCF